MAADAPHAKVASFLTGDKYLFAPSMVDVHVDAPPQGYDWDAVKLAPGHGAVLTMDEVVPAELLVKTELAKNGIRQCDAGCDPARRHADPRRGERARTRASA